MVRLLGPLHVVAGEKLSHPWDANAFFIGGEEPTLIDCGSTEGYSGLKQNLAELGYAPGDVRRVLVTHAQLRDGICISAGGVELRAIHTPGHTPGSVTFDLELFGLRILLTGDTVWGGFNPRGGSDLASWERSLDRILELDFDALGIGHSPPTLVLDARTKVREARQQFGTYLNPWFKPFYMSFRY